MSTRRTMNSITGDTFWKPVTGWKTIYRLTGYHFNIPNLHEVNDFQKYNRFRLVHENTYSKIFTTIQSAVMHEVANIQQTNKQTDKHWILYNLCGGNDNNVHILSHYKFVNSEVVAAPFRSSHFKFPTTFSLTEENKYQLLPPQSAASQNYNLRRHTHDRQLHEHQGHLSDSNFITKLLDKNSY